MDAGTDGHRLLTRAGTVSVDDVAQDVLERLLAGHVLTAGELGLDTARRLVEARLVVPG